MVIRPIRDEEDYKVALERIEQLWDAEPGTPEADELEVLVVLVEAYEKEEFDFGKSDPIEAILYFMESRGLSRSDLQPYIGSRGRVSEILNRKRALSINMIRALEQGLGIPAEILIQPYELDSAREEEEIRSYLVQWTIQVDRTEDAPYQVKVRPGIDAQIESFHMGIPPNYSEWYTHLKGQLEI
jgi:HTH-type transcriptional regulator/antitoxin HigA